MTRPCLPAREAITPPCFDPPAGACDAHAHVFGPYAQFPLDDDRSYTPREYPTEAYLAHLRRLGMTRGVLVTASACGTDNRGVLAALAQAPDALRGVVVPSPNTTPAQLQAWHEAGVRGVRVNLFRRAGHAVYRNGIGLDVLEPLGPTLAALGWHVQVWVHAPDLPALAPRLERLGLPLVIDHMGRMSTERGVDDPGFRWLCRMLREGLAWTKISGADRNTTQGSPYRDLDPFVAALRDASIDRLVWGSDWPHINYVDEERLPDDGELLNLLARWLPDPQDRRRVLVDNPARLYGFAG